MPFDGSNIGTLSSFQLPTSLRALGYEPVSMAVLEQHKKAEIAKHPASFYWRHQNLHVVSAVASFVLTICSLVMTMGLWMAYVGGRGNLSLAVAVSVTAIVAAFSLHKLTTLKAVGPAEWKEVRIPMRLVRLGFVDGRLDEVPEALLKIVKQLAQKEPHATLIIGTLMQETVDLDPYLLVEEPALYHPPLSVCLGIWDDTRIIHRPTEV